MSKKCFSLNINAKAASRRQCFNKEYYKQVEILVLFSATTLKSFFWHNFNGRTKSIRLKNKAAGNQRVWTGNDARIL